jgi:hypothetical protein
MSALTDFLENKLLDWFFRAQAIGVTGASAGAGTGPTTLYVGLLTAAPSDTGGGTEVTTTSSAYARVGVTSGLTAWLSTQGNTSASTGSNGTISNAAAVTFPTPSGSNNWGVITHFALFDAASSGNMLIWAALTTPKTVNIGDAAPAFATGALTFQIDN